MADRVLDQGSGARGVHVVGLLARRRLRQDALGILPEAVLLELVFELDAQAAREHGQIVLDRNRPLSLEGADETLAAVIDRRKGVRSCRARPVDLVEHHAVPGRETGLLLDGLRADAAESGFWLHPAVAATGH